MTEHDDLPESQVTAKPRILLCDDTKVVRLTASKILRDQFDVVLAEDGEQGWEKICSDNTIQVVFTDLSMPNLDGYGLIKRVRASDNEGIRNLPLIVITGADEEEKVRSEVFDLGATDFISKPFKSATIRARADAHASYQRTQTILKENTQIDALTGLLNAKGFNDKLQKDLSFVKRHHANLCLVVFELDNFADISVRIGQKTSEKVIIEVSKLFAGSVRKEDSLCRNGFACFNILLPMAKTEGVIKLAKRLCDRIKSFKLTVAGEVIPFSASAGIAAISKDVEASPEDLMAAADNALANAKAVGHGEVQLLKLNDVVEEPEEPISIDAVLEQIEQGEKDALLDTVDSALKRLKPLIGLLTLEQKRWLIGDTNS